MKAKLFLGPLPDSDQGRGRSCRFLFLVPLGVRQKLAVVFNVWWMQQQGKKRVPLVRVDLRFRGRLKNNLAPI